MGNLTSMIDAFIDLPTFNQDISYWNVSLVTAMNDTFAYCPSFNQNISDWTWVEYLKWVKCFLVLPPSIKISTPYR